MGELKQRNVIAGGGVYCLHSRQKVSESRK